MLLANDVAIQLIPTPRQISSDCGMVVQVHCDDLERVQELLRDGGLEVEGAYDLEK
jgi:hypothetical protein